MCGIYGITAKDPKFINDYIKLCHYRGPDGANVYLDDYVTLGHNLLSIMSTPKDGTQPWLTPKGNILVYNGEIFNYYDLVNQYKDFQPKTTCDTELLAWGLDTFGLDFINQIDSMHGFAYYDRNKKEIILSRDHAGIKPVFYAETKEGLVFGSEIKGLLDKVPNARKLDQLAASFFNQTGISALRNTFFTGIKKLLAGETIVYDIPNKKIKSTKRIFIKPKHKEFNPDEFRLEVSQAVKRCAIGQRPIGVFLSGGLDSSMIAYELSKIQPVRSFTNYVTPGVNCEEDYNEDACVAKKFASEFHFQHTPVEFNLNIFEEIWQESAYVMEHPVYNPSMPMYCHTNRVMSNAGIVVTIAGDMGDELLGGYPKYTELQSLNLSSWDEVTKQWCKRLRKSVKVFTDTVPLNDLIKEFQSCYPQDLWTGDPVGSYMALDCVTQCPEDFFMRNDKYGMRYSMEGRFPLASKRFMTYAQSIPAPYRIQGHKKRCVIQAYRGHLPMYIINKRKTGWTAPIGNWITGDQRNPKASKVVVLPMLIKEWSKRYLLA